MFGLSAKERLAQLQQKGSKDAPVGKLSAGLKPTPGKLNSGPGQLKKPEPLKPAADLKKTIAPQPAKPKEEPKTPAVQEPAKPKELPKAPVAPEQSKPKEELQKSAPVKPIEELKKPAAPEPAKPKEEPKKPAAPEPAKPKEESIKPAEPARSKEEPAKPAAPEPAKPKEDPKKPAAPEPAKPKEESIKPAVPEPAKPKEEPKKTAAPEPAKPKDEPKKPAEPARSKEEPAKPAAPEPAKPKEDPKKPAAPEPGKPKEDPKKPVAPEPAKPKDDPKTAVPEPAKPKEEPKKQAAPEPSKPAGEPAAAKPVEEPEKPSDDFFHSIFYFSGMGTLVGSALAEGVYVPEKTQRNALDSDEIESARERQKLRRGEEIIATARNQAQGLSNDFRHLQVLLESLPTFTEVLEPQPLDRRAVDQVIHGHVYFQQEQHPAPTHSRPPHHHPLPFSAAAEIASQLQSTLGVRLSQELSDCPDGSNHLKRSVSVSSDPPNQVIVPPICSQALQTAMTTSVSHQEPVTAPPHTRRPPSEPTRPHARERPMAAEQHSEGHGDQATRPIGVHTGQAVPATTQPWQERYGQTEVTKFAAPRPFSATGGEIDSKGIKPWQMSHLRTLEVKGYHIVSDSEPDAIKSYAPYLVSDRSQGADRQHFSLHHQHPQHRVVGSSPHPTGGFEPQVAASPYRPPEATNASFAQSLEASVGYSDL